MRLYSRNRVNKLVDQTIFKRVCVRSSYAKHAEERQTVLGIFDPQKLEITGKIRNVIEQKKKVPLALNLIDA